MIEFHTETLTQKRCELRFICSHWTLRTCIDVKYT